MVSLLKVSKNEKVKLIVVRSTIETEVKTSYRNGPYLKTQT